MGGWTHLLSLGEDIVVDGLGEEPAAVEEHVHDAEEFDDEEEVGVDDEGEGQASHAVAYSSVDVRGGRQQEGDVEEHREERKADAPLCRDLRLAPAQVLFL